MKDFLAITDYSPEALQEMLDLAIELKAERQNKGANKPILKDKTLAMIFQKPSLRTRVSFDMGMRQLGGDALPSRPIVGYFRKGNGQSDAQSNRRRTRQPLAGGQSLKRAFQVAGNDRHGRAGHHHADAGLEGFHSAVASSASFGEKNVNARLIDKSGPQFVEALPGRGAPPNGHGVDHRGGKGGDRDSLKEHIASGNRK